MPVTATSFGLRLFARHPVSTPYHPSDSLGVECPLKSIPESDLGIKPQGNSDLGRKSGHKPLPAVLDGMDKAEALACWVGEFQRSRLFAGKILKLLMMEAKFTFSARD